MFTKHSRVSQPCLKQAHLKVGLMKRILKALFGLALLAVIGFGAYSLLCGDTSLDDLVDEAKTDAVNTALDASGVKDIIQNALESNKESIASALGISVQDAQSVIDDLDIESWSVTTLPDDAQETSSYSASVDGTSATVTLYDDSSYVTVEAYGQSITLSVPESAQGYLSYLSYIS